LVRCFAKPLEEGQQTQRHNARQQNYRDNAGEHDGCLAAKPIENIAPLLNTATKIPITTDNTDGIDLLLYSLRWKKQVL